MNKLMEVGIIVKCGDEVLIKRCNKDSPISESFLVKYKNGMTKEDAIMQYLLWNN